MLNYVLARRNMVDCQLRTADVTDRAILAAMGEIPREHFLPADRADLAYSDQAVAVTETSATDDEVRYMLPPVVLARLIQALGLRRHTRVLDVAAGLGCSSAVISRLSDQVVALEASDALSSAARSRLDTAGLGGAVETRTGPLDAGCPDAAPFDAILLNGSLEVKPDKLLHQLADGGRLACLLANGHSGHAVLYVRSGEGIGSRDLFDASAPVLRAFRAKPAFAF